MIIIITIIIIIKIIIQVCSQGMQTVYRIVRKKSYRAMLLGLYSVIILQYVRKSSPS